MGRSRYKIYEEEYPYFITSSIVGGYPIFSMPEAAQIVLDGLIFLQNERDVQINAYVVMENHIHFIALGDDLAGKIGLFKSYTARQIIDMLSKQGRNRILSSLKLNKLKSHVKCDYQLWQKGFHPKQIVGDKMMMQKIEYIHQNPVKRGYVDEPEVWRYSSARSYAGIKGLIPITCYKR